MCDITIPNLTLETVFSMNKMKICNFLLYQTSMTKQKELNLIHHEYFKLTFYIHKYKQKCSLLQFMSLFY